MAVDIFCKRHYRGGDAAEIVFQETSLIIEAVESVLVGTYPHAPLAVDEGADDTGATDEVLVAHLVAHIVEALESDGLTVKAFLQKSEPEVAALVLGDGADLTLREVHLHAEEGVVEHMVAGGLIDGHTLAVVADDNAAEVVAKER